MAKAQLTVHLADMDAFKALASIVSDLADTTPSRWETDRRCALCDDLWDQHTDPDCPWLRAIEVTGSRPT